MRKACTLKKRRKSQDCFPGLILTNLYFARLVFDMLIQFTLSLKDMITVAAWKGSLIGVGYHVELQVPRLLETFLTFSTFKWHVIRMDTFLMPFHYLFVNKDFSTVRTFNFSFLLDVTNFLRGLIMNEKVRL